MDTARQVLRFSIPGSIAVAMSVIFVTIDLLVLGYGLDEIMDQIRENGSAAIAIFAAIPVGFLLYQIYYASYRAAVWPWWGFRPWRYLERRPRRLLGRRKFGLRGLDPWVRADRGGEVLSELPVKQLERIVELFVAKKTSVGEIPMTANLGHEFGQATVRRTGVTGRLVKPLVLSDWYLDWILSESYEPRAPKRSWSPQEREEDPKTAGLQEKPDTTNPPRDHVFIRNEYDARWRHNWGILRGLIELVSTVEAGKSLKAEYTVLSDIYHALGACRTGVELAWLLSAVVVGFLLATDSHGMLEVGVGIAGLGATFALALTLFAIFHVTRRTTWNSARTMLEFGLTAILKDPKGHSLFESVDIDQLIQENPVPEML